MKKSQRKMATETVDDLVLSENTLFIEVMIEGSYSSKESYSYSGQWIAILHISKVLQIVILTVLPDISQCTLS